MKTFFMFVGLFLALYLNTGKSAPGVETATAFSTVAKLPIKEVTVFKDGHAFVAHEGELPVDAEGNAVMDYLPVPVMGTFWPYSVEDRPRLVSVVAAQKRVVIDRTALNLRELLEANIGAEAIISEVGTNRYEGTILMLPQRSGQELAASAAPNTPERLPEKGSLVLVKTAEGTRAVPLDRIQEVTFKNEHRPRVSDEEFRNLLRLKLEWGRAKPAPAARLGLFYLQRGMRWIPSYKVEIDGDGHAKVKLQATLLNELADLENAAVNLVIGVPSFSFKDTIDPMALQQTLAQLSQHFQPDSTGRNSPLAYNFSNAIMSQSLAPGAYRSSSRAGGAGLGPEISEAERNEDLFLFTLPQVSLRRGERMVVTLAEFSAEYQDIFTLDQPLMPPPEVRSNVGSEQQRELARLFHSPKVMHKIRLTNGSKYPLTTAPALILRQGRVLGQGLMTYTSPGAKVDLALTAALEFQVKATEKEIGRTPNAITENGVQYSRIDLSGSLTITSHRDKTTEIEVTRYVLGIADRADENATREQVNVHDPESGFDYPYWWGWYSWPWWSHRHNGVGLIRWTVTLEPRQAVELSYRWHYFWQ